MHYRFTAAIVKQQIVPSKLQKCQQFCSNAFPQSEQTVLTGAGTACGVGLVYRWYSCCCNVAGGCTTLIERSLVCHAYEKLLKELQTEEN